MNLRKLAIEWDVDPEPLLDALASAQRVRRYREGQKPLIASAEPAECEERLKHAHKAIAALPVRARAHLHWAMVERIASSIPGLDPEQIRSVMGANWPDLILAALSEPIEREEPDRELQWLVQAWVEAGGEVEAEVGGRYDGDLIQFLTIAYQHLGEEPSRDALDRRLDRIRRDPPESRG